MRSPTGQNGLTGRSRTKERHFMNARGTAFASDFDGTLCQSNWETGEEYYAPEVLEAVRRYQAVGGLFGICTGRPLFAVVDSLSGILDLDFYIVTTGAQVLDRNRKVLFERTMDCAVAAEIFDRYAADGMDFLAITDDALYSVGHASSDSLPHVASIDEVEGKLLGVSLEYHGDESRARSCRDDMNERYANAIEGFQNLGSVDVVAAGCSKGSGVHVVRDSFGVSCVAGAGDSYNDLPLLISGQPSFTFHASPQEVQDAATYVVADLAEALAYFD